MILLIEAHHLMSPRSPHNFLPSCPKFVSGSHCSASNPL